MPWQGVSTVDLRVRFVTEYLSGLYSMTELAEQYAISRKTGYKWVARYETAGPAGLLDRSWRPQASPAAVEAKLVQQVVQARRRKPYWGARKLRRWLATREPAVAWPRSSIQATGSRAGSARSEQFGGAISPCFSPRPSRVKRSRSKQSTTGCGRCIAATSPWHAGSSGNAACLRCRLTKRLPTYEGTFVADL